MKIPYVRLGRQTYAPIVKVELWSGEHWIGCEAYVDSGASHNLFHSEIAGLLGINYTKGKRLNLKIAGRVPVVVYLHKLKVRFCGKTFKALIGFTHQLGVQFNFLGREDFFERFKICFDDKNKTLTVT